MLILTRKLGEGVAIGDDIRITVIDVKGKQVRLGIEAPTSVPVYRDEIYKVVKEQNISAAENVAETESGLSHIWDMLKTIARKEEGGKKP